MRVAFLTTRMMLGYGVDLTIHEIASRLVEKHSLDVDVWTPTSDSTYDNAPYQLNKITVYGAPVNRALPMLEINARIAMGKLKHELDKLGIQYDAVIPSTHPYYGAGSIFRCPEVFFNFGNVPTAGFSWKGKLNWAWLDFSERFIRKPQAKRVVIISEFLKNQQSKAIQKKDQVIHLGGDHYFPAESGSGKQFRERYQIPEDAILVGYCGRLHKDHPPYKGTKEILTIAERLAIDAPNARVVLLGIGSPDDQKWVEDHKAIAAMNVEPKDMPGFYDALDIYLCASTWEGFNLPIVEAAWHSVPAIAYDAGAHNEHVTQVLVDSGNMEELYTQTLHLIKSPMRLKELSENAHNRALHFSWDNCADRFFELLLEVMR